MNEILVTVFRDPFTRAWRPGADPEPHGLVLPLVEALERVYTTDAHMVSYVAGGHRLLKDHEHPTPPMTHVLLVDVDNPGHAPWNDETFAAWLAWYPTLPILATCGVYATKGGWRIVQPLEEPIPSTEVEPYILGWYDELHEAGILPDPACKDWTRLMRLPHVWRKTGPYQSPRVALEQMVNRTPRPAPANRPEAGEDQAAHLCEASPPACLHRTA